jgi:hypothetical protein
MARKIGARRLIEGFVTDLSHREREGPAPRKAAWEGEGIGRQPIVWRSSDVR